MIVRRLFVDDFLHELIIAELSNGLTYFGILWVHHPTVVQRDLQMIENGALRRVLKVAHPEKYDKPCEVTRVGELAAFTSAMAHDVCDF